jgi:phenylpropionate dioxygenase-like ring-hydroxylating dioxygenase large terminal subunit
MNDPLLANDWHPVLAADALQSGAIHRARLLGQDLALWRSSDGAIHAWEDRCPHRGSRLTRGRIVEDQVVCAYHAWHFGPSGQCARVPSQPDLTPPDHFRVNAYRATVRYGLVWVCLGTPQGDVLPFPEYDDPHLRTVLCGPYEVETGGPRIVENFLDMAHFPFVHTGILGDPARTEVRDYDVASFDDGTGAGGVIATKCFFWQPQTNSLAHGGSDVEYSYRVVRPLTAILTKVPEAQGGFREAISLHVQPVDEERSVAWIIMAMTNFVQPEHELRAFQDRIFLQDKPIVENQVPKRLPLAARAELAVRGDRLSAAYRRYLRERGLRYGVLSE